MFPTSHTPFRFDEQHREGGCRRLYGEPRVHYRLGRKGGFGRREGAAKDHERVIHQ